MFSIANNSSVSIFEQIVDQVGKFVALGILKPNTQLPPVRVLAKELGINPNTVSKAYQECENRHLTYSVPGKGSFIAENEKGLELYIKEELLKFKHSYSRLIELGMTQDQIIKELNDDPIN